MQEVVILSINIIINVIWWVILLEIIFSFILDPFHPIRQALGNITRPLLDPIRRVMPPTGFLDFSPMVLLILLYLIRAALFSMLASI